MIVMVEIISEPVGLGIEQLYKGVRVSVTAGALTNDFKGSD